MRSDLLRRSRTGDPRPPRETAPKRKSWRHPTKRDLVVPYQAAAVIALMEMGLSDYATIADAVGLSVAEVESIEAAQDRAVRQLCVERIPIGQYFKLRTLIRCPRCSARISVVPCIACACQDFDESHPSEDPPEGPP